MYIKLYDHRKEVEKALSLAIERGLMAIGSAAETHAKKYCPVDTGRLKNSISFGVDIKEETVVLGTNVEYAPSVELGTSRQKSHPYLQPAATKHNKEYVDIMKKSIKNA